MPDHASGQPLPDWGEWDCCDQVHDDGTSCTGAAQADYGRCVTHLGDTQLVKVMSRRVKVMSRRPHVVPPNLDARGVRLSHDDLNRVLAAARSKNASLSLGFVLLDRATVKGDVSLDGATVKGDVSLDGATVKGEVSLAEATVEDDVSLDRATVVGSVSLDGATVKGDVSLPGATVEGEVFLSRATVEGKMFLPGATVKGNVFLERATVKGDVSLHWATVEGEVFLGGATVEGDVSLLAARVEGDVFLERATVKGDVSLPKATVKGNVFLDEATVEGEVSLHEATVGGEALLGPMSATMLSLGGTEVTRRVILDVTAEYVELSSARFLAGLTARIREAEVAMELVEVQGPAVLARATAGSVARASPPRLLQLAGTDVASLTLTGVDLSDCRFSGAINLDKLHIDGSPQLAVRQGWGAHRRVLAEEHVWRYVHGPASRRDSWYPAECRPRDPDKARQILNAEASAGRRERAQEIATVYRALRKGREDGKDEPGAADFYYGEMEMRRKAAGGSVEGMLLTGYWLLSGYGLRAWRAFTALVALIAVATVLFTTVGFAPTSVTVYRPTRPRADTSAPSYVVTAVPGRHPGWVTALNYSVQSTTSLLRSPSSPPPLTGFGQTLEIFLRFAGPGLLALTVLALRARVKR